MSLALDVNQVSYAYAESNALNDVSFGVSESQFTALLGPNGSGKTTLFSLVCRLLEITEGTVCICGIDISTHPVSALARVGIVFQQPTLDLDLSVGQNLHYFAALRGISRALANRRIDEELSRLGLTDSRTTPVRKLSGGHRRRVELARALLHEPSLLLLDEPTVGLDMPSRRHFIDYVHALTVERDVAVLWATHLIDEINLKSDHLVILNHGRVVAASSATSVIQAQGGDDLQQVYRLLTDSGDEP